MSNRPRYFRPINLTFILIIVAIVCYLIAALGFFGILDGLETEDSLGLIAAGLLAEAISRLPVD